MGAKALWWMNSRQPLVEANGNGSATYYCSRQSNALINNCDSNCLSFIYMGWERPRSTTSYF